MAPEAKAKAAAGKAQAKAVAAPGPASPKAQAKVAGGEVEDKAPGVKSGTSLLRRALNNFRPSDEGGVGDVDGLEAKLEETKRVATRVMNFQAKQDRLRREEDLEQLQDRVDQGQLTEGQARMIVARARMREGGKTVDVAAGAEVEQATIQNRLRQTAMAGADITSANMMLEDILDSTAMARRRKLHMQILAAIGYFRVEQAVRRERERRAKPSFVHPYPRLKKLVYSSWFDIVVGIVMVANALVIGLEISMDEVDFGIIENLFLAFFIFEIVLRAIVDGWVWFWNLANFSDTLLIFISGFVPLVLLRGTGMAGNNILRIPALLRILRLVRLVRMVRLIPFFRIFWALTQGILDSGMTLLYTYLLLTAVLYVLAIFAVAMIGQDDTLVDDPIAQMYFGDVPTAMFALFQVVTLDNWTDIARPLMKKNSLVAPFLIGVIAIGSLALLNLIIAVIVTNAAERSKQDEELLAKLKRESDEREIDELAELFSDIDVDGSGKLSKDEYQDALQNNDEIITKFEALSISPGEYQDIWNLLDDGSGETTLVQFADLLRALRGDAKAKDTFSILRRIHQANWQMSKVSKRLELHRKAAADLRQEATVVRQSIGHLQHEMCEFIKYMGECIPSRPAPITQRQAEEFGEAFHQEASKLF